MYLFAPGEILHCNAYSPRLFKTAIARSFNEKNVPNVTKPNFKFIFLFATMLVLTLSFRDVSLGIGCAYVLYRASATLIRGYFISRLTALNEFAEISATPTRKSDKLRGTAVICGGSVAGLLTAKVCSDHFENVVVVESEEWVTTPEGYTGSPRKELADKKRSHVSQYKATHIFKPFLVQTLLRWFPNLREECNKIGGQVVTYDWIASYSGFNFPPFFDNSQPNHLYSTLRIKRAGFEVLLRRLVLNSCQNVRYLAGTALGLEQASDSDKITGVHVRTAKKEEIVLPAILAIDCTGPSSAGLRWLRDLATAAKNDAAIQQLDKLRMTYDPKQTYRTCEFDVPPELVPRLMELGFISDWNARCLIFSNYPDTKIENKMLLISRRDYNHLEFLCGGWAVSEKISSIEDMRSFISNMRVYRPLPVWILQLLDLLEEYHVPLAVDSTRLGIAAYIPYNLYESIPSNFVAIGDSVLRLNPSTGTGCTKACIEALTLGKVLNKCHPMDRAQTDQLPEDFSKNFSKLQALRTGSAWEEFKIEDYDRTTTIPTEGDDPKTYKAFQRALGRVILSVALKDEEFAITLGSVKEYFAPSIDLFTPRNLFKFLKFKLFEKSTLV